jgi:hypothetical protein
MHYGCRSMEVAIIDIMQALVCFRRTRECTCTVPSGMCHCVPCDTDSVSAVPESGGCV